MFLTACLGYKLRTHLSKSLQRRCKAIRQAVKAYNHAAEALHPPRNTLHVEKVTQYSILEEFQLLQDTRNDIRNKRWAQAAVREIMKLRQRIARAREELVRCNVEMHRLQTAIRDEELLFDQILKKRDITDPIRGAAQDFITLRKRVNARLLSRIHKAHTLPGFQCNKEPGTWLGLVPLIADPTLITNTRLTISADKPPISLLAKAKTRLPRRVKYL